MAMKHGMQDCIDDRLRSHQTCYGNGGRASPRSLRTPRAPALTLRTAWKPTTRARKAA